MGIRRHVATHNLIPEGVALAEVVGVGVSPALNGEGGVGPFGVVVITLGQVSRIVAVHGRLCLNAFRQCHGSGLHQLFVGGDELAVVEDEPGGQTLGHNIFDSEDLSLLVMRFLLGQILLPISVDTTGIDDREPIVGRRVIGWRDIRRVRGHVASLSGRLALSIHIDNLVARRPVLRFSGAGHTKHRPVHSGFLGVPLLARI